MPATLRDVGEFPLIERLLARLPRASARVIVGPGDDAAASTPPAPGSLLVSTVDMLAEGVDFTAAFPPRSIGRKAIAVNLSDLAAMGAKPTGVLIALAAPASTEVAWVESLYDGIGAICAEHGVDVLGGDVSRASGAGITISVTALGEVPAAKLVKRSGARVGDRVCVSGSLGDAAAGLERVLRGDASSDDPLVLRQLEPRPRSALGAALGDAGIARAMIDVSDGFLADLGHLLDASHVGARIETAKLPISRALAALGDKASLRHALAGGEDFELIVALAPADLERAAGITEATGVTLTDVGVFVERLGTTLVRADGTELPPPSRVGWDHFKAL